MATVIRVLSLGWGVQSFTLAAMAALGDIEPIAAAVHSDTTWERQATYKFAAMMTPWLEERGVRVVRVEDDKATKRVLSGEMIPAYSPGKNGNVGWAFRTCTQRWKIIPLRRWLSKHRNGDNVSLIFGISQDEWQRMRISDVGYIENLYPLIDMNMTRNDCKSYLIAHDLPIPVKSSCTFCPFHSDQAWGELKRENGEDWYQAVEIDEKIRNARHPRRLFLHDSCKPLPEAVRIPEDEGAVQLTMLDDTACDGGYCFV